MTVLRWECHTCLLDYGEPYCSSCGADLSEHPLTDEQRRERGDAMVLATVGLGGRLVEAGESRRVPGVRSAAELRRIARTQGIAAAEQVASLDAVYAALKPGKAAER